ncbi:MAG TPA: endonuclease III domain-containing protein [bacterium]|nr:endonuclease III domain-containing protein [bacterium]
MKPVECQRESGILSPETLLLKIYYTLYDTFGPQHWWPGESKLEVVVGAILTQNTNWKNVEKAINNLKERGILSVDGILESEGLLPELIKSAGYYRVKTERLINVMKKIKEYKTLDIFLDLPVESLRSELLSIKGVGEETADSIILYAAGYPVFIVDAYTRRIFSRLGIIRGNEDYGEIQSMVMNNTPNDAYLYNEFHALLVELGKRYCRKIPVHRGCPLSILCKEVNE